MKNKYAGRCYRCGRMVHEGEGETVSVATLPREVRHNRDFDKKKWVVGCADRNCDQDSQN